MNGPRQRAPDPGAPERAAPRTAAGYTLAGLLLGLLLVLLGAPLWSAPALVLAAGLLGVGAYRRKARDVWAGLILLGAGSFTVSLATPTGFGALVVLVVGGPLFALLATALGETGAVPPVRPDLATRSHHARTAGLCTLWAVLVLAPLAFAPTRLALSSEMGTTLAVLLVAGSTVLAFGLPLATLRDERQGVEADELRGRGVRFIVDGVRDRSERNR